ncbi:type 2 lantibiotic biosynthesis protein LanM [Actinokineospora baliensis]|uniref:type 2 lanthipeptide synthetase LanM family protein n=1 Tax=Actinokineospora baliensis TaxID=547056 RepID=UPI001959ABA9|nr:type 2 lanthipeptide synthetase LanM family protein [Actinokineospora baliensis]MBM7773847.1 type 2 lantibiotic biosynthesis protein LanM [Actinokineospora baliensis]
MTEPQWWRAAQPPEAAESPSPPGWALFVDGALRRLDSAGTGEPGATPASFDAVLAPVAEAAADLLVEEVSGAVEGARVELGPVVEGWVRGLSARLAGIATRALVADLAAARAAGELRGDTPQARFADFIERTTSRGGLRATLYRYPVLGRLIGTLSLNAVAATGELLRRFAEDRSRVIADLLSGDPGALVSIGALGGDPHEGGRAAASLRFADGSVIVYKPRPLDLHQRYDRAVRWLNARTPDLDLRTARCLARPGYGWVEHIAHRDCADQRAVDRFYRRQGAILALLYAVDGADMHFENLIAHGDHPVLVDIETVFHPAIPPATVTGGDPASDALAASVCRTALLPQPVFGEHGAVDLSGLGGDAGALYPHDAVDWAEQGTDRMRLVRTARPVRGADNRPTVGGCPAAPENHKSALLAGFRAAYQAITAHRAAFTGAGGPLEGAAADTVRVLVRPTQVYVTVGVETTHPDALRTWGDRERALGVLSRDVAGDPVRSRLAEHEVAHLRDGDIPLFTARVGELDLWAAGGARVPAVLAETPLAGVLAKVAAMDEMDRQDQEWLIAAAMATRTEEVRHRAAPQDTGFDAVAPVPARLLAAACNLADDLVARALHGHGRANWLGVELVDERYWSLGPLGAGLGEGYTGVALFLAEVAGLTGAARYADLARAALVPLSALVAALDRDRDAVGIVGCGFHGLGGIAYASARAGALLADPAGHDLAARCVAVLAAAERAGALDREDVSVSTGAAGGLAAAATLHRDHGVEGADGLIALLAERAAAVGAKVREPGFARGRAGVGWALTAAGANSAGRALLEDTGPDDPADPGWCAGLAGLVAAGVADAEHWSRVLATLPPRVDMSLCHGESGRLEAIAARGTRVTATDRERVAGRLLGALESNGPVCATPGALASPGLLTGLSGIGFGLLRLGFARAVPSVLLLGNESEPLI